MYQGYATKQDKRDTRDNTLFVCKTMSVYAYYLFSEKSPRIRIYTEEELNEVIADIVSIIMSFFRVKKPASPAVIDILQFGYEYEFTMEKIRGRVRRRIEMLYKYSYRYEEEMRAQGIVEGTVVNKEAIKVKIKGVTWECHTCFRVALMDEIKRLRIIEQCLRYISKGNTFI